jgi:malate synthase
MCHVFARFLSDSYIVELAATLHALHYHQVDVFARQTELASRKRASLDDILTGSLRKIAFLFVNNRSHNAASFCVILVPLLPPNSRPDAGTLNDPFVVLRDGHRTNDLLAAITNELELNAQSSLGYVARWIQFGIGTHSIRNISWLPLTISVLLQVARKCQISKTSV